MLLLLLGAPMQALDELLAGSIVGRCSEQRSPPSCRGAAAEFKREQQLRQKGSRPATFAHHHSVCMLVEVWNLFSGGFGVPSVGFGSVEQQGTLELCLRAAG